MTISIITVCFNSATTIRTTIESVLSQQKVELEYLIIDGSSSDGTVEIIKEYAQKYPSIVRWVSEPDAGIYDAMNKGIKMATGDIIGILNSDDCYSSNDIFTCICKTFSERNIDSCYGNLVYIKNGKPYRYWKPGRKRSFKFGWMLPHPTFFVKNSIYIKYGLFKPECGVNADYELMLRLLHVNKISSIWINKTFVYMTTGGVSSSGLKSTLKGYPSDKTAWKMNQITPFFFTLLIKRIIKILQYFRVKFYQFSCGVEK